MEYSFPIRPMAAQSSGGPYRRRRLLTCASAAGEGPGRPNSMVRFLAALTAQSPSSAR